MLQQTLRDLDRAFVNFFSGRARVPRFRRKGRADRFRIQSRPRALVEVRRLSRRWAELRIPKLGWVRMRWTRRPLGEIKHVTISRDALGWHAALCCERNAEAHGPHTGPPVGIDRGVVATVVLSTGKVRSCPQLSAGQIERLHRLSRKAGRQETLRRRRLPGQRDRSRRHQRTLREIARLRARQGRIRRDFLHKLSHDIAKSHGFVVVEGLRVTDMTRSAKGSLAEPGVNVRAKSGLNRAILEQGWSELQRMLAYNSKVPVAGSWRSIQPVPVSVARRAGTLTGARGSAVIISSACPVGTRRMPM